MNQIIIQGIGYIALFFVILSFQRNKRSKILFFLIFAQGSAPGSGGERS